MSSSFAQLAAHASQTCAHTAAMVMGSDLMIDLVKSPEAGWLVIHAANGDEAGDVLGYVAVPAGESKNVTVKVLAIPAKMRR